MTDDDRLERLDYYTLLGVGADVPTEAIKRAFHQFARKYHPDRFAGAAAEKRARAAQIYRRGAEGYRVITDPALKREYDAGLKEGRLRHDLAPPRRRAAKAAGAGTAEPAPPSPKALPFAHEADEALAAGDLRRAKLNLQIALRHDPRHVGLREKLREVEGRMKRR